MNTWFSNQDNDSSIPSYSVQQSLRITQHTTSAAYADYYYFTTLETNNDFLGTPIAVLFQTLM